MHTRCCAITNRRGLYMIKEIGIMTAAAALSIGGLMGISMADSGNTAPTTPATTFHNTPGNNPGFDGATGQPNGGDPGNSNGIHEVGPGEAANALANTDNPPACNFHGGLDAANQNCD
jgi:hypothetical protein